MHGPHRHDRDGRDGRVDERHAGAGACLRAGAAQGRSSLQYL